MNKLSSVLFNNVKLSLKLAERGEVCRMHRITIQQVRAIEKAKSYEEYCKGIDDLTKALRIESKMAVYNTQTKLDELHQMVKELKESMERLELMK
jgi:hypothetical protein